VACCPVLYDAVGQHECCGVMSTRISHVAPPEHPPALGLPTLGGVVALLHQQAPRQHTVCFPACRAGQTPVDHVRVKPVCPAWQHSSQRGCCTHMMTHRELVVVCAVDLAGAGVPALPVENAAAVIPDDVFAAKQALLRSQLRLLDAEPVAFN
jgi:hypothetical protein